MNEQITISDVMAARFYDRNGKIVKCPEWVEEKRCGNCIYWQMLSKDEQPPSGWAVRGSCGSYMSKGQFTTSQTSYCQEWHEKPMWE